MDTSNVSSRKLPLVVASSNVHKIREFRTMFKPYGSIDVLSLIDFPSYEPPEETGNTFEENASIKALHAAKELQHWVISDDSGLVVPALNNAPGIYSARFAGNNASDLDNRKKLIDLMSHLSDDERSAYYECFLVLASPQGIRKACRGTCEGKIISQERGGGGFGYDSLFIKNEYNKTFAELEESIKNRISHRRKAFDKLIVSIETLVESN